MSIWTVDADEGPSTVDTAKDDLTDEQLEGYYLLGDLDAGARLRDKMTPYARAEYDLAKRESQPSRFVWQPGDVTITPPPSRFVWQPGDVQVTPAPVRKECGGMVEVPPENLTKRGAATKSRAPRR